MQTTKILDAVIASIPKSKDATPFNEALSLLMILLEEDVKLEREYALKIREMAAAKVMEACSSSKFEVAEQITCRIEDILKLNATVDFDSYCLFMEWNREPKSRFYQPRRHVLYPKVVVHLQDLADGELDFLSISMPPRTCKSTTCIFFLTWIMGKYPKRANLMCGYSDKLTEAFYKEALSIITDSHKYRFAEVFPNSPLVENSAKNETISLKQASRFPTLTCRSIEGTLTGAVEVGKDALLYMDDIVEDREQALNDDRMDKLYQTYLNQLKDRLLEGAKQLFVATRWSPNDPIGKIKEEYGDNPRYRFVRVPALDENGNSNFVYEYGLGFSTDYYEDMRKSLIDGGEEDSWWAKYMAAPYDRKGRMFPEDELKYYSELPEDEPDAIFAVCDTKDRGTDYCVQPIVYVYGSDHYVESVICDNSLPEVFEPRLVDALCRHNVSMARYESNSAGGRLADDIQKKCDERGHVIRIKKKYSTENKETRILADSDWIKQRCFFKENPTDVDYKKFMNMLTKYTVTGKNKNDDAPDAMSMYKRFVALMVKAKVQAVKRII